MRFTSTIAALALSLTFSAAALADDYSTALDALTGEFSAVIGIDADQLINRPISKLLISGVLKNDYTTLDKAVKDAGYDLKKDLDTVVLAMAKDKGFDDGVVILVLNKSTDKLVETLIADEAGEVQSHREINYWLDKRDNIAVYAWNDKNVMLGDPKYIKAFIDRSASGKGKGIKDNKELAKLVKSVDMSKDIWFVGASDKNISKKLKDISLSSADGTKSFRGADVTNVAGHISAAAGIAVVADTGFKTDLQAKDTAFVVNENITPLVSDPSLSDMGMGFLATCYDIKANKKKVNSKVNLTHEQVSLIFTLVGMAGKF